MSLKVRNFYKKLEKEKRKDKIKFRKIYWRNRKATKYR